MENFKRQHIEFLEGNPYICKTEKEFKRMQRKYKLVQIKDGFWKEVERDMKGYIKPCMNCEEICKQIEELIITFLKHKYFNMSKDDSVCFWRTLQAFSMNGFSDDVLSRYYDEYMSIENKQGITKERFIEIMNGRWR